MTNDENNPNIEQIEEYLAKLDLKELIKQFAPTIKGLDEIKTALALQMVTGKPRITENREISKCYQMAGGPGIDKRGIIKAHRYILEDFKKPLDS